MNKRIKKPISGLRSPASESGFTLIELLVVIAIIGFLTSIIMTSLNSSRIKARDVQRQANVKQIMTALEQYYDENGEYPGSGGAVYPNSSWDNSSDSSWDDLVTELQPYIASTPGDPINQSGGWAGGGTQNLNYFSRGYGCDRQWYMLVYVPEDYASADSPGVSACDSTNFNYSGTVTIGNKAQP